MTSRSPTHSPRADSQMQEAYDRAMKLLYACATPDGFLATPTESANYRRVWTRDGVIMGLAALLSEDHDLVSTFKHTLQTLGDHQGPHGEIPSNVDPLSQRVSYGGTTGRVDADLWFLIGCAEYWRATGDDAFLETIFPVMEKTRFLLGAWEFNNRGLLYIPQTGDWADEYVHAGYVLYDQVLYLQAQRALCAVHAQLHGGADHALKEHAVHLRHLIRANYWFDRADETPEDVYHEILYQKGLQAASPHCAGRHWMSFFSPTGYGYRFDAFANVLTSLLDIADDNQRTRVDELIETEIVHEELPLLPAFHPVIKPVDEDWKHLQVTFSYTFKNKPYEFHNGGLWQMVTAFYVADLTRRGCADKAHRHLQAIHNANALEMDGRPWGFPEFVHGRRLTAGGTQHQGWSAAAAVIGHHALQGDPVFRIDDHGHKSPEGQSR